MQARGINVEKVAVLKEEQIEAELQSLLGQVEELGGEDEHLIEAEADQNDTLAEAVQLAYMTRYCRSRLSQYFLSTFSVLSQYYLSTILVLAYMIR